MGRIPGDKLKRVGTAEYDAETGEPVGEFSDIHKGDKNNGTYEEWYSLEQIK
ncbi:MAG: hypothetical protein ACI4QD_05845 [Kiritimatiellia bacterium]